MKISEITANVNLNAKIGGSVKATNLANFLFYVMNKYETIKDAGEKAIVARMAAKAQKTISLWGNITVNAALNKKEKDTGFFKEFVKEAGNIKGALENDEIKKLIEVGQANRAKRLAAKKAETSQKAPVVNK